MEEVVKIEEAIAHQGKVLIRDGQDALKRIDVDQDISQLVIRNQDLITEPARVVCIRRESLAIKNARKKFNVPEKRYKRTKPKNSTWTARFASMFSGDSTTNIDATTTDETVKSQVETDVKAPEVDVTMKEVESVEKKKKDEYISLTENTSSTCYAKSGC